MAHQHGPRRVAKVNDLEGPPIGSNERHVASHGQIPRQAGCVDLADDGQKPHGCHLLQGGRCHLDDQVGVTLFHL